MSFTPAASFTTRPQLTGTFGMAASTHPTATAVAQAVLERGGSDKRFIGVFSLRSLSAEVSVELPDGSYPELISGASVEVKGGKLQCAGRPMILEARQC